MILFVVATRSETTGLANGEAGMTDQEDADVVENDENATAEGGCGGWVWEGISIQALRFFSFPRLGINEMGI